LIAFGVIQSSSQKAGGEATGGFRYNGSCPEHDMTTSTPAWHTLLRNYKKKPTLLFVIEALRHHAQGGKDMQCNGGWRLAADDGQRF
jgi:hypothetical protein